MARYRSFLLVIVIFMQLLGGHASRASLADDSSSVPASRLARLARTANVTRWYRFPLIESEGYFKGYLNNGDLKLLRELGFGAIRLTIAPQYLYSSGDPTPNPTMLSYLDTALDRVIAADIAVIIDIHDEVKTALQSDDKYREGFVGFWENLAKHLSRRDPEMLFLEVVNEPLFEDNPESWFTLQKRLLAAMRKSAPNHTLIATGTRWSSIDGLLMLTPVADRNVIYTFHFYDPHFFTHQGATWAGDEVRRLRGLPYPNTDARCAKAADALLGRSEQDLVTRWCQHEKWDFTTIDARIKRAADWGQAYNVPLLLGEFGVYCPNAPAEDRLRWIEDVRKTAEKYNIAWSLWGYDECFGLQRRVEANGKIILDEGVAKALGLKLPSR
jgi:endoglucanase